MHAWSSVCVKVLLGVAGSKPKLRVGSVGSPHLSSGT